MNKKSVNIFEMIIKFCVSSHNKGKKKPMETPGESKINKTKIQESENQRKIKCGMISNS